AWGSNSTSPASTSATALSTRPLHSGSLSCALAAIAATASRHAARLPKSGAATASQESVETATIVLPFPLQRVLYLAVGEVPAPQRPLYFNMTRPLFALTRSGSSPCFPYLSATVQGVVSCPVASSCCNSIVRNCVQKSKRYCQKNRNRVQFFLRRRAHAATRHGNAGSTSQPGQSTTRVESERVRPASGGTSRDIGPARGWEETAYPQ